jgi:hypothetical protein
MDKFYCIQLNRKDGTSVWVINATPDIFLVNQYTSIVTKFDSWESANMFVKENKLNADSSVIVKIYSNAELMQMDIPGIIPLKGIFYYLEATTGEKCCMSASGYYFKRCEVGFCCWPDPTDITPLWEEFMNNGINCSVKELKAS